MRNNRGFTIIELMIVVVFVGIVAAIAISSLTTLKNDRERSQQTVEQVNKIARTEYLTKLVTAIDDYTLFSAAADEARSEWLNEARKNGPQMAREQLLRYTKIAAEADRIRDDYNREVRLQNDEFFKNERLPRRLY